MEENMEEKVYQFLKEMYPEVAKYVEAVVSSGKSRELIEDTMESDLDELARLTRMTKREMETSIDIVVALLMKAVDYLLLENQKA